MIEAQPSQTALRVALRRAAHQIHDEQPLVFVDPLAVRILPAEQKLEVQRIPNSKRRPYSAGIRAFMVVRSRFAEDVLAASVARGVATQYLLLGAGLDTFAYRNPHEGVRVFEVDHPATQAWKRECLEEAAIAVPESMRHVAVDFEQTTEQGSLATQLLSAGFSLAQPTVVAWLGVVPYLTLEAFRATLRFLSGLPAGSELIFDYTYPRHAVPLQEQLMMDSMQARVTQAGEPFQLYFLEEELRAELSAASFALRENLDGAVLSERFFAGRSDGLGIRGKAAHLAHAERV
ncbi:MAG: class I SAM-dependent methyltransferase [Acidobacteriaceae bacterium]|nr:class I SAM-dependent methyltransferase [Acidobacteriaceae bacterium]